MATGALPAAAVAMNGDPRVDGSTRACTQMNLVL